MALTRESSLHHDHPTSSQIVGNAPGLAGWEADWHDQTLQHPSSFRRANPESSRPARLGGRGQDIASALSTYAPPPMAPRAACMAGPGGRRPGASRLVAPPSGERYDSLLQAEPVATAAPGHGERASLARSMLAKSPRRWRYRVPPPKMGPARANRSARLRKCRSVTDQQRDNRAFTVWPDRGQSRRIAGSMRLSRRSRSGSGHSHGFRLDSKYPPYRVEPRVFSPPDSQQS